ncbi:MAG: PilZ domain-containing protein [Fibrobacteres bacterium]|nr:PilZ domain-containing protein [Fibrobacterota bacterium]
MIKKILSVRDVASLCAVAPSTVQYWEKNGYLKSFKTLGGHRRFERANVISFLSVRGRTIESSSSANSERRSEPRFPVNFTAVAKLENAPLSELPEGRLADISANGCSLEIPASDTVAKDILDYLSEKPLMKVDTENGASIIKTPFSGSVRNFSLKEGLLRIGLSFN